jgi:hypothetical protein
MHLARLLVGISIFTLHGCSASSDALLVSPLTEQDAIDGCSWSASSKELGDGFVFLAEYDDSRTLMNIDGSDIELDLVDESGNLVAVGDVLERTYQAEGVLVNAKYTTTWVCPDGSESCEVTRYKITFDVSKGSRRQVVQATGDVGC